MSMITNLCLHCTITCQFDIYIYIYIYIYTTSEKPVNDQSYVGSLRYNDTIQVKQL